MSTTKPTIKDIAKRLGVSVATVSKALNGYSDVNKQTKARVLALVEKLNFIPNQQAINFRKKSSSLIGLVLPQINHFYFSILAEQVIGFAEKDNINVVIKPTFENLKKEIMALKDLIKQNVDGILISLSNETRNPTHLIETHKMGIPIVEFDRISKLSPLDKVTTRDKEAAYKAVQHLIDRGKKTIAHLRGPLLSQNFVDRFLGYKSAIEEAKLIYDEALVIQIQPNSLEGAKQAFLKLFKKRPDIDAVFAVTDITAVGALEALKENAVKVPAQVSVVGFSNWQLSSLVSPKLTTIDQNPYLMAKAAYALLKRNMSNKESDAKQVILIKTDLIIRESS